MSQAANVIRRRIQHHAGIITLNEEIGVGGVTQQTLIVLGPTQALAKGWAAQKKILQHLPLVCWQQLPKVQANIRIAGNVLNSLPEVHLGAVGVRSCSV